MTAARKKAQSSFGNIDQLKSKRWRARYRIPGSTRGAPFVNAPKTFTTKKDAEAWLASERTKIERGAWITISSDTTVTDYANQWLKDRTLKPTTRSNYRRLLDDHILTGGFAKMKIKDVRPAHVKSWYRTVSVDAPTQRAHCYSLLKSIMKAATIEELISANPCTIEGASTAKRKSKTEPASLDELKIIEQEIPERYRLMISIAAWCAMRFGELVELRVKDLDFKREVIKVRRAVTFVRGEAVVGAPDEADEIDVLLSVPLVGTPKTDAGTRDVAIPPHLIAPLKQHIKEFDLGKDALLFPAARDAEKNMRPSTLYKVYYPAREKAGRKDLRFHDLRHTGAVMAAIAGATIADLMERLGHSTPAAAMRYQHSARGRQSEIAQQLSKMATTHVIVEEDL